MLDPALLVGLKVPLFLIAVSGWCGLTLLAIGLVYRTLRPLKETAS